VEVGPKTLGYCADRKTAATPAAPYGLNHLTEQIKSATAPMQAFATEPFVTFTHGPAWTKFSHCGSLVAYVLRYWPEQLSYFATGRLRKFLKLANRWLVALRLLT
jgi:hypothetical protein